jgi:hypothetical protein
MWKSYGSGGQQAIHINIIQRMRTVRWVTTEIETKQEYVNFSFCTVKGFTRTRL